MSTIDLLMGLDAEKLTAIPEKELKLTRLSEMTGGDFIVKVRAVSAKRFTELVSDIRSKDGGVDTAKAFEANIKIALAGLVDPSMKDKELQEHFGASTPGQLIEKIFNGAEIGAIADAITELSGFSGNVVEKIKN